MMPRDKQLCIPLNRGPAPRITTPADVLFANGGRRLAENVLPDFIDLDVVNVNVTDQLGFHRGALLAHQNEQVGNRADMRIGHAGDAPNRHPLQQEGDNLFGSVQPNPHPGKQIRAFGPARPAILTAPTLGAGFGCPVRAAVLMLTYEGYHGAGFPSWELCAMIQLLDRNRAKAQFRSPQFGPPRLDWGFLYYINCSKHIPTLNGIA
jgi:hypothetical protein